MPLLRCPALSPLSGVELHGCKTNIFNVSSYRLMSHKKVLTREEKIGYFVNYLYKVSKIGQEIIRILQEQGSGSCSQLAAVVGVSRVTAHEELRKLKAAGEVKVERKESRGGRPGQVYTYSGGQGQRLAVILERRAAVICVEIERVGPDGREELLGTGNYAALEVQSLEGCVAEAVRGVGNIRSIGLIGEEEGLRYYQHVGKAFHCVSSFVGTAESLTREREGVVGVYLGGEGKVPEGGIWHAGKWHRMGRLDWLPMPANWQQLDYSDHTLVEEMVARLVQIISCVVSPRVVELHADFWSNKLSQRIRFNVQSKLQGASPSLLFHAVDEAKVRRELRKAVWRVGDSAVHHSKGKIGGNRPASRSHKD